MRSQKTTQKFIMADTASRQEALAAKRQKQKEREEKWVETQIIGFTSWINSFVTKRGKKVEKLETAFQDGLMLVDFLELAGNFFFFFFFPHTFLNFKPFLLFCFLLFFLLLSSFFFFFFFFFFFLVILF